MLIKQYDNSDLRASPPHLSTPPAFDIIDNGMHDFAYMPAFKFARGMRVGWDRTSFSDDNSSPGNSPSGSPHTPGILDDIQMTSKLFGPVHACTYCGVKFNNPSNLEVHLQYYCGQTSSVNKATSTDDVIANTKSSLNDENVNTQNSSKRSIESDASTAAWQPEVLKSDDGSISPTQPHPPSPANKGSISPKRQESPPLTGAFRCQMCSYTADKKSRLVEHMSSQHLDEPDESGQSGQITPTKIKDEPQEFREANQESPKTPEVTDSLDKLGEWHCEPCDIHFSSLGNYTAHKEFYCGTRGRRRNSSSSETPAVTAKQRNVNNNNLYTNYPPAMIPAVMPMAPGMLVPMMTPFGMTYAMVPMPTVPPSAVINPERIPAPMTKTSAPKSARNEKHNDEQPLDLSCKRDEGCSLDVEATKSKTRRVSSETERTATSRLPKLFSSARSGRESQQHSRAQQLLGMLPQPMIIPGATADVNRCEDCNIVFFKHENYKVHKQLYCAGRRHKETSTRPELKTPPSSPRRMSLPATPENKKSSPLSKNHCGPSPASSSSSVEARDASTPEEYALQYVCVPCNIKYSNPDTLEAHQQFYCPASKAIAEHAALHSGSTRVQPNSPAATNIETTCIKCTASFNSNDDLVRHVCTHTTMKIPMFCCPYCDYVAQSDNRLLDHIKAHAPTKQYRCELCGYRGNTVRGMRMHGKTHMDAGENFTDDHMTEYSEPPLIPKRLRTVTESVEVNVASELLRANVEHVHRRKRSRPMPSYQSSAAVDTDSDRSTTCSICHVLFPDANALCLHMKVHSKGKEIDNKVTNDTTPHGSPDNTKNSSKYNIENILEIPNSTIKQGLKRCHNGLILPKVERDSSSDEENKNCDLFDSSVPSEAVAVTQSGSALSPRNEDSNRNSPTVNEGVNAKRGRVHYCKQCDIPFVYMSTFLAHKKYYCSSHAGERNVVTPSEV